MTDWTGSSRLRRERGLCTPPAQPPNRTPRFVIPAGTQLELASIMNSRWFTYTTRVELGFPLYEQRKHRYYYFRHLGWLIRVSTDRVRRGTWA